MRSIKIETSEYNTAAWLKFWAGSFPPSLSQAMPFRGNDSYNGQGFHMPRGNEGKLLIMQEQAVLHGSSS